MKKVISVVLAVLLAVSCLTGLSGCGSSKKTTLYVYNWGQYISEGDDGSLDVIAAFEEAYPNIRVQYSTYDSNEIMYSKLSNGGITVDVIIPSDYMIGRMVQEGMLEELNFDNIPNYQYIDDSFKNTSYDPENKYSVPYTWGTVGIIYNTKYVDEADVTGWELLWNEKYAGKILMFDNSRDAFGIAEYLLGYDVNTTDETEALRDMARLYERMVMRRHTNGGYHNVVTELWRQCEAWNTNIVIMWQHVACKNMATVQGLLDEQGRELGLHLIWIPHDLMDPRTVSRRTMRDTVSSYMDTVMHATPVDETLLDFADDVCM